MRHPCTSSSSAAAGGPSARRTPRRPGRERRHHRAGGRERRRARNEGYAVEIGDGTDTDTLRSAGAENAKTVVAATGDDDANLLVSQLASSKLGVERVIARANNPDNVEAFEDLGVRTIVLGEGDGWAIDNQTSAPYRPLDDRVGRSGDVRRSRSRTVNSSGSRSAMSGRCCPTPSGRARQRGTSTKTPKSHSRLYPRGRRHGDPAGPSRVRARRDEDGQRRLVVGTMGNV